MLDISVIIFAAALIALVVMFLLQWPKVRDGRVDGSHKPSYEHWEALRKKSRFIWLAFAHGSAIIASKTWARITHFVSGTLHKGAKRLEREIMKHEKSNGETGRQSVFLTTVKTYKHEIKRLKGRVEEELPRPREAAQIEEAKEVDNAIQNDENGVTPE